MANHKSAIKRNRQSLLRKNRNRANKTRVKNLIKAVDVSMQSESVEKVQEALHAAISVIQQVASKGTFHKKNASRKVSRLTKRINSFVAGGQAAS